MLTKEEVVMLMQTVAAVMLEREQEMMRRIDERVAAAPAPDPTAAEGAETAQIRRLSDYLARRFHEAAA